MLKEQYTESKNTHRFPVWAVVASVAVHVALYLLSFIPRPEFPDLPTTPIELFLGATQTTPVEPPVAVAPRLPRAPAPTSVPSALASVPSVSAPSESAPAVSGAGEVQSESVNALAARNELEAYVGMVTRRLDEAKSYPRVSQRREEEGRVVVDIEIHADGSIGEVHIEKPCAFEALNEASLQAARSLRGLPAPGKNLKLRVPMVYRLDSSRW